MQYYCVSEQVDAKGEMALENIADILNSSRFNEKKTRMNEQTNVAW